MHSISLRTLNSALALLIRGTGVASAADGQIPINAACAAVGCGAGDAAGFPITLSQPGSYVLTSDSQGVFV